MSASNARAILVESLPIGMEDLQREGVGSTADFLLARIEAANHSIDITALYWSLRPDVLDPEMAAWSAEELVTQFGADRGIRLFEGLRAAAQRRVLIRIIQSPGFAVGTHRSDSDLLVDEFPGQVEVREVDLDAWFGQGIMHQKICIFDDRAFYIGSANMDWRSMSQVKELGIVVEDSPPLLADVRAYFSTWWEFAGRTPDADVAIPLDGPETPDAKAGRSSWAAPLRVVLDGVPGEAVVSGSPAQLCVPPRTADSELMISTILDARSTLSMNVMDFAPISIYSPTTDGLAGHSTWWPDLMDAVLHAVIDVGVNCRLLVSEWEHTSPYIGAFLDALQVTTRAAAAKPLVPLGRLEIRRFRIPGWRDTATRTRPVARYPGHTRVNHVKYLVTDRRLSIGTSNMTWDYFHGTAGVSVNLNHPHLVERLQDLFDRDWDSRYALPHGPMNAPDCSRALDTG